MISCLLLVLVPSVVPPHLSEMLLCSLISRNSIQEEQIQKVRHGWMKGIFSFSPNQFIKLRLHPRPLHAQPGTAEISSSFLFMQAWAKMLHVVQKNKHQPASQTAHFYRHHWSQSVNCFCYFLFLGKGTQAKVPLGDAKTIEGSICLMADVAAELASAHGSIEFVMENFMRKLQG